MYPDLESLPSPIIASKPLLEEPMHLVLGCRWSARNQSPIINGSTKGSGLHKGFSCMSQNSPRISISNHNFIRQFCNQSPSTSHGEAPSPFCSGNSKQFFFPLTPPFKIASGITAHAQIGGCTPSFRKLPAKPSRCPSIRNLKQFPPALLLSRWFLKRTKPAS